MAEQTGLLDRPEFHILRTLSREELLRIDVEWARATANDCPLALALRRPIVNASSVAAAGSVTYLEAVHFLVWFDAGLGIAFQRYRPRREKRAALAAAIAERLAELGEGATA